MKTKEIEKLSKENNQTQITGGYIKLKGGKKQRK
jgi:hypothetical protein